MKIVLLLPVTFRYTNKTFLQFYQLCFEENTVEEKHDDDNDDEIGINQMVHFLNKAYFLPLSSL